MGDSLSITYRGMTMNRNPNPFILRVWRQGEDQPGEFVACGSAIYLGQRYALTCWHVIVGDPKSTSHGDAQKWVATFHYQVTTDLSAAGATSQPDGTQAAVGPSRTTPTGAEESLVLTACVTRVVAESPRGQLDLALLELEQELPVEGLRLLDSVNQTFIDDLPFCDELYACGYACRTDVACPTQDSIQPEHLDRIRIESDRLLDLQLIQGGVVHGYSGGALVCGRNNKKACLAINWLGGETAATSRFTTSDVMIERFLRPAIGDSYEQFVMPAKDWMPSHDEVYAGLLDTYRRWVRDRWGSDFV